MWLRIVKAILMSCVDQTDFVFGSHEDDEDDGRDGKIDGAVFFRAKYGSSTCNI